MTISQTCSHGKVSLGPVVVKVTPAMHEWRQLKSDEVRENGKSCRQKSVTSDRSYETIGNGWRLRGEREGSLRDQRENAHSERHQTEAICQEGYSWSDKGDKKLVPLR